MRVKTEGIIFNGVKAWRADKQNKKWTERLQKIETFSEIKILTFIIIRPFN
jgi:hypothetical protein